MKSLSPEKIPFPGTSDYMSSAGNGIILWPLKKQFLGKRLNRKLVFYGLNRREKIPLKKLRIHFIYTLKPIPLLVDVNTKLYMH